MIHLTLRYLSRHWRLNVVVLLGLTLASALAASLSSYADAIAAWELSRTWDEASPAQRSLLITGPRDTFTEELYVNLQEKLGKLLMDRMAIRHATLAPDPPLSTEGMSRQRAVTRLDVYSFDKLIENVRVVEGRLPESVNLLKDPEPWRPPPIEAVIGVHAAAESGYRVGDRLTASGTYHRLDIVGIVEPLDPRADIWGEDVSAFTPITNARDLDVDAIPLPLIIDSYSMQTFYPFRPVFPHAVSWRITLNPQLLSVDKSEALHSNLINFQTQSATVRAVTSTGLVRILADYLARLSRLRMVFLLLTLQTLFLVLYTLTMFASFVVDRSQAELATLSGRGASAWQIIRGFALENLILASMAMVLCPALALGALRLWSAGTGEVAPIALPGEAWLLSGVVAVLGWLALVLPVFLAARRNRLGSHRLYARPPQQSAAQKRYLDLYLLAFGGLLYWQLNQSGSVVMRYLGNTPLADPVLLIGPSLLLIAVAMVFLRVLPFLLQIVAWLFQNLRGITLSQGLFRLSRDSQQPSQVILLVSLTTGLVLFTQTLENSLAGSPEAMARYLASALQLNALALVLFSVTMFFLTHLFTAQRRAGEFDILRAMGLSLRHWLNWLMIEGALVLFLGLAMGTIVGLGLSRIMIPYLAQALTGWQLGITIEQTTVSWLAVAQSYVLLIAVYGLALALVWVVLVCTRERWAVRMEDR
jgi:hypothetical protein